MNIYRTHDITYVLDHGYMSYLVDVAVSDLSRAIGEIQMVCRPPPAPNGNNSIVVHTHNFTASRSGL